MFVYLIDQFIYLIDQFVLLEVFWQIFSDQLRHSVVLPHEQHVHAADHHHGDAFDDDGIVQSMMMILDLVRKGCSFTLSSPATKSDCV